MPETKAPATDAELLQRRVRHVLEDLEISIARSRRDLGRFPYDQSKVAPALSILDVLERALEKAKQDLQSLPT
jgi:hypothetical protein